MATGLFNKAQRITRRVHLGAACNEELARLGVPFTSREGHRSFKNRNLTAPTALTLTFPLTTLEHKTKHMTRAPP